MVGGSKWLSFFRSNFELLDVSQTGGEAEVNDEDLEQDSIVSIKSAPPPPPYCTAKAPIWSLGVALLWQAMGVDRLWPGLNTAQTIRKILTVANSAGSVADRHRLYFWTLFSAGVFLSTASTMS